MVSLRANNRRIVRSAVFPSPRRFGLPTVYVFFAAVCVVGALFVRSPAVPETKGRSLEEIQALLSN